MASKRKSSALNDDPTQVNEIDADGDLILRIGSEDFKVCSATMRRTSPVWKRMLFGPWKESKSANGEWVVELPEDDPSYFAILLAMAHGRFQLVPRQALSLLELYNVLILTDKYDLFQLVQPWANGWAQAVRNNHTNLTGYGRILRLHVAWELGCEDVVSSELTNFVFNLAISKSNSGLPVYYYDRRHLLLPRHCGPPDFIDMVTELRLSLIQRILDFYHDQVNRRMYSGAGSCQGGSNNSYWDQSRTDKPLCDALILGSIWRHLERSKRASLPEKAIDITDSANQLMQLLSAMFKHLPSLNERHESCSPGKEYASFEAGLRAEKRWTDVLRPHHITRMEEQRKRTGVEAS